MNLNLGDTLEEGLSYVAGPKRNYNETLGYGACTGRG